MAARAGRALFEVVARNPFLFLHHRLEPGSIRLERDTVLGGLVDLKLRMVWAEVAAPAVLRSPGLRP